MLAVDDKSFPDYAYCAIADSRKHTKDKKIQFVALITSKPAVGADGRLHWTVTDRTGIVSTEADLVCHDIDVRLTGQFLLPIPRPGVQIHVGLGAGPTAR